MNGTMSTRIVLMSGTKLAVELERAHEGQELQPHELQQRGADRAPLVERAAAHARVDDVEHEAAAHPVVDVRKVCKVRRACRHLGELEADLQERREARDQGREREHPVLRRPVLLVARVHATTSCLRERRGEGGEGGSARAHSSESSARLRATLPRPAFRVPSWCLNQSDLQSRRSDTSGSSLGHRSTMSTMNIVVLTAHLRGGERRGPELHPRRRRARRVHDLDVEQHDRARAAVRLPARGCSRRARRRARAERGAVRRRAHRARTRAREEQRVGHGRVRPQRVAVLDVHVLAKVLGVALHVVPEARVRGAGRRARGGRAAPGRGSRGAGPRCGATRRGRGARSRARSRPSS